MVSFRESILPNLSCPVVVGALRLLNNAVCCPHPEMRGNEPQGLSEGPLRARYIVGLLAAMGEGAPTGASSDDRRQDGFSSPRGQ